LPNDNIAKNGQNSFREKQPFQDSPWPQELHHQAWQQGVPPQETLRASWVQAVWRSQGHTVPHSQGPQELHHQAWQQGVPPQGTLCA